MDMIQANANRLQGFVNSLVDIMSNDKAMTALNLQRVNLTDICHAAIAGHMNMIKVKGLVIKTEFPDNPVFMEADGDKLQHAISNIISNAVKFTERGHIAVKMKINDQGVEISVKDTGCGIPPEDLSRVFDRFYQSEEGRNKKGSGIGLTLAKRWIEAHEETISIQSQARTQGTTVLLNLRLKA